MEKKDFVHFFMKELEITNKKASYLFDSLVNEMQIALKQGDKIKISNIWTIMKKKVDSRKVISNLGKKPKKFTIKEKTKIKFNPSESLKNILNS